MQVFEDKTGCKNIGKHYLNKNWYWKKFQNKSFMSKNGNMKIKKIGKISKGLEKIPKINITKM